MILVFLFFSIRFTSFSSLKAASNWHARGAKKLALGCFLLLTSMCSHPACHARATGSGAHTPQGGAGAPPDDFNRLRFESEFLHLRVLLGVHAHSVELTDGESRRGRQESEP